MTSTINAVPDVSWFALRVRSRSEMMVSTLLESKGYQSYSPSYVTEHEYSDRTKRVQAPLFPGYVFCRFSPAQILPIVSTPAVQSVVGIGPRPEAISDAEIERIQLGVLHGRQVLPCAYMQTGQKVRVLSGALSGVEGFLVEARNRERLVITTDILRRAVSVEVNARNVVSV